MTFPDGTATIPAQRETTKPFQQQIGTTGNPKQGTGTSANPTFQPTTTVQPQNTDTTPNSLPAQKAFRR